jgi:hypothetical protein
LPANPAPLNEQSPDNFIQYSKTTQLEKIMAETIIGMIFFSTFMLALSSSVVSVFMPYRFKHVVEGVAGVAMVLMVLVLAAAVVAAIVM